ncbi:hypothetical protein KFK09_006066 [Dendrobium nobile]|uniref:GRPD C-terminal domain-containing protein n=1 Tax=Dendrobium nobile TaxID=94219 RepID=A0A8T3BQA6_DENNO|nr:hypothetical protein KFK09_006066 [Dendrobium nobile]
MSGRNVGLTATSPSSSTDNSDSGSHHNCDRSCNAAAAAALASFSLTEEASKLCISIDLVAAARRHLSFLRSVAGSPILHQPSAILYSIRRYEEIWMPMMADLSSESSSVPMLLPPLDVEWVWLCHCLDSEHYREYCVSKFGAVLDRPAILDKENEEYAADRCRDIWNDRHPSEPFDFDFDEDNSSVVITSDACSSRGIFASVAKHSELCSFFSDPFVPEIVYLVSARRRYINFLLLMKKSAVRNFRMVPAADIRLMWHTHQSFPGRYVTDMEGMGDLGRRVVGFKDQVTTEEAERTTRAWEVEFDEPYERAGVAMDPPSSPGRLFFNWDALNSDVNRHYKGLQPRFLMEVTVFLKGKWEEKECHKTFLRMRTVRSHKELKLDKSISESSSAEKWRKTWHLYCEFSARGIVIEVRKHGNGFLRNSKLIKKIYFYWNDLLRSTTLTLIRELEFELRALSSVTPPVQAPYLLKTVPDCVTDDSGAMMSDVILKMKRYRPQEGRWLSRTVLDHAGRECFVIRTRVGRGFWRRGADNPVAVKWDERIIEVREGQWSYVASSVGYAPEKVVGVATPAREDSNDRKIVWSLSTGDVFTICWEDGLSFQLQNESSDHSVVLQEGRKLQYQVSENNPEEEEQYITIVRSNPENPDGKATALLNWKLQAIEFLPDEDAVFVLLLNMAILRTISQIRREDIGGLLVRRRVREISPGIRDWGSVSLPANSSNDHHLLLPHFKPWYCNNANEVLASAEANDWRGQNHRYSPAVGKDELYRSSIIS